MNTPTRGNIYFIFILGFQIILILMTAFTDFFNFIYELDLIFQLTINQVIYFFIPFVIYLIFTKQKFSDIVHFKKLDPMNLGLIILMSIAVQPLTMTISMLSSFFFKNVANELMLELFNKPPLIIIITIGIVPAFFEEITMRGVILSNYENVRIKRAAIINGFLFGFIHMNLNQFFYAFALGIMLAYFAYYTGSILAPMLSHFIINSSQAILSIISFKSLDEEARELLNSQSVPTYSETLNILIFIAILFAIFLPVFVILFKTFIQYNKQRRIKDSFSNLLIEEVEGEIITPPVLQEPPVSILSFWIIAFFFMVFCVLFISSGI